MANSYQDRRAAVNEARREDWFADSILSGFAATFAMSVVMTVAFGLTRAIGNEDGNRLERWFWALGHNPVTETTLDRVALAIGLNLLMGLGLALVYGGFVEPRLSGPGWRRGVLFALVPFVASVILFLPILGGGFLGADIDAGPLPVLGNLILHLVYGWTLGTMYGIALEAGLDGSRAERNSAIRAERGGAVGILVGLVLGMAAGTLIAPTLDEQLPRGLTILAFALIGGGAGLGAGSLLGIGDPTEQRPTS